MKHEKKPIRILIADDHEMIRQSLKVLVELDQEMSVIHVAQDGEEAVAQVTKLQPDVVIMDIAMPRMNGLQAAQAMYNLRVEAKVLMVSAYADDGYIEKALNAGVSGFLIKKCSGELLFEAIRKVFHGQTYFCPLVMARIKARNFRVLTGDLRSKQKARPDHVSPRELQVLQRIAEGLGNKEIAQDLMISVKTVEKHRQRLMDKLNIHGVAGLTRYALIEGLIEHHG